MSDDPVFTSHQVAEELGVHYKTLLRYVRDGELKAAKRGGRLFIRRSWVEQFLAPTEHDDVA